MNSFEAFFYPPFLEALSEEFYPPQTPGVAYTLRQFALDSIQRKLTNLDRELDAYGEMMLTYRHNLPWAAGVEGGVDARIVRDFPRIGIVFLYDRLVVQGSINEFVVSVDEPNDTIDLNGTQYRLTPADSLIAARTDIVVSAQRFFDQAIRE